ncbi:MAG: methylmalonyl-CoA mutase [Beijerinckiaceae bacterium]|nr:methylmalonyl-CoA mutase [Beijerinckiaceae bacterium]
MSALPFIEPFPPASRDDWMKLVDKVLKGAEFEKKLVSRTYDGIRIEPLYAKADGKAPLAGRAPGAPWAILQRVDEPDTAAANSQALTDLENGATGLSIIFKGAPQAFGFGIDDKADAVAHALEGVYLDAGVLIALEVGMKGRDAAHAIIETAKRRGVEPSACHIAFGLDPVGVWMGTGFKPADGADMGRRVSEAVRDLHARGFKGPFIKADGRIVHEAGGSEAQELGSALALAVFYMRALEASGFTLEQARDAIEFRLSADADQFLGLAKFRAIRALWASVQKACGLTPTRAFVSATTSARMMTARDPWVNLLRETTAVFAAGIGGADAITTLPFTQAIGLPDAFARRLARNTQLILLEESNLARVADPAAGSGGIEALTDALIAEAWTIFQTIEQQGGIYNAVETGAFVGDVAKVRDARAKAIASRKEPITGVSEFPNILEAPVAVLKPAPVNTQDAPLKPIRLAAAYEKLRDSAQHAKEANLFLANLGPIAAFTARAMFAKNFFEAGGIKALSNDGFVKDGKTDLAALIEAFKKSGAPIACLCSSDEIYASEAAEAARALKAAGAKAVYLAGRPGDLEAALKAAGVDDFIFMGLDVLASLKAAQARLSIRVED